MLVISHNQLMPAKLPRKGQIWPMARVARAPVLTYRAPSNSSAGLGVPRLVTKRPTFKWTLQTAISISKTSLILQKVGSSDINWSKLTHNQRRLPICAHQTSARNQTKESACLVQWSVQPRAIWIQPIKSQSWQIAAWFRTFSKLMVDGQNRKFKFFSFHFQFDFTNFYFLLKKKQEWAWYRTTSASWY